LKALLGALLRNLSDVIAHGADEDATPERRVDDMGPDELSMVNGCLTAAARRTSFLPTQALRTAK
jgi:hypothetical protein